MTKQIPLLLAFILLAFLPQHVLGQMLQFENQIVEQVDIIVHARSGVICDTNSILNRLRTKQNRVFSQADFDEDLKILAQDYDRVDPQVNSSEDKVSITIHVWPKPTIRTICWHGNHQVKTSRLQKELGISCFSVFERQAFNLAFHKLKAYYISHGYFEAQLDYHVEMDL